MNSRGKISKKNAVLGYGFVSCAKDGDVFFSIDTTFSGTSFEELRVDEPVRVVIVETERGLFAQAIEKEHAERPSPQLTA